MKYKHILHLTSLLLSFNSFLPRKVSFPLNDILNGTLTLRYTSFKLFIHNKNEPNLLGTASQT